MSTVFEHRDRLLVAAEEALEWLSADPDVHPLEDCIEFHHHECALARLLLTVREIRGQQVSTPKRKQKK